MAALNHPNICTLHDVGPNYLVMELIEGPTLAGRLKGAIPPKEALVIARQIAENEMLVERCLARASGAEDVSVLESILVGNFRRLWHGDRHGDFH